VIKLSFKGIGVLKNRIDKANTQLESILYNVLENEANYIEIMSKLNAPHKTGALRGSQYKTPERSKNKRAYKIGFRKLYGVYQEFGTGNKFKLNSEYQEFGGYASQFKIGTPRLPVRANRYFLHYFVVSRKRLSRETNKIFKRLLR
jgi:hypothetical protein